MNARAKPILVLFATREGHTRKVAEHIAAALRAEGRDVTLLNAGDADPELELREFSAAILAASVHVGAHEKAMVRFVRRAREALARLPTAFLSISLSEAGAENESNAPEIRQKAAREVADTMNRFFEATGWHPDRAAPVAGALMYREYNVLIRWVMRRIARASGGSVDTTQDHIYTDWQALDRFVALFLESLDPA